MLAPRDRRAVYPARQSPVDFFITAIITVSVSLLMWLLIRASRRKPALTRAGNKILRYPVGFSVVGYILMGFAALFGVILAFNFVMSLREILIGEGIILIVIALAVWLVLYLIKAAVEFNEEEIVRRSLFHKPRIMKWSQVAKVTYGRMSYVLSLRDATGKIGVNAYMVGFPTFVETMKAKLPSESYREACMRMEKADYY
jgi:hypothetical protein